MTPQLTAVLLDAQAANAAQQRALYDPSPEVDSALEHALFLLKTANDAQRPHARALVELLKSIHGHNAAERHHERTAVGLVENPPERLVSSVHEFRRLALPLLVDLANPIMARQHDARLADLHALFERTRPVTRRALSMRPLLGVSRYTALVERLDAWEAIAAG